MLARNVLFNLVGLATPILLALLCIPPLIAALGTAPFGLLTLVWVVLGYFSVFDLGIGRALTLAVSERRATEKLAEVNPLATTAVVTTAALGCIGGALLAVAAGYLAPLIAGDSAPLTRDAEIALYAIAAALPFVTTTAALRGILEAYGRFDLTSAIRLGMGFVTYGGPLVVLQLRAGLVPVVMFLAIARVVSWGIHVSCVLRVLPDPAASPRRLARAELRRLLVSGGWMTVSNVVSPLLTYLDRFVVAYFVGATLVAYYTAPYEAISRLTIVPEAVLGVLFPALGAAVATDPEHARRLCAQMSRVLLAVMLPVATVIVVFSHWLLAAWISPEFADHGYRVLQILTVGVAVNSVARVNFTAIQSIGRADVTAKLHLCELPAFLVLLVALTHQYGLVGAALAWTVRVTLDFVLLLWLQSRLMPVRYDLSPAAIAAVVLIWVAASFVPGRALSGAHASAAAALGAVSVGVAGWAILTRADRTALWLALRRAFRA